MRVAVVLFPITLIRVLVDFPGESTLAILSNPPFHLVKVPVLLFTYRFKTLSYPPKKGGYTCIMPATLALSDNNKAV